MRTHNLSVVAATLLVVLWSGQAFAQSCLSICLSPFADCNTSCDGFMGMPTNCGSNLAPVAPPACQGVAVVPVRTPCCSGSDSCSCVDRTEQRTYLGCTGAGNSVCDYTAVVVDPSPPPDPIGCTACTDSNVCTMDTCIGAGVCDFPPDNAATQVCYDGPPSTDGVGLCSSGESACSGGAELACGTALAQVLPSPEICDGADNDCDGVIDDFCATNFGGSSVSFGPTSALVRDLDFADLDLDGDLDLLVAYEQHSSSLVVFDNDGTGGFTQVYESSTEGITTEEQAVAAGDCDNDGDPEVFLTLSQGGGHGVRMFKNVAGALNYDSTLFHTNPTADVKDVLLGDFDLDGDLDLVVLARNDVYETWENDGSCGYTKRHVSSGFAPGVYRGALGDLSGDGYLELVIAGDYGWMLANWNPVTFAWTTETTIPPGTLQNHTDAVIGDWDGDGQLEFMLALTDDDNRIYKPCAFTGLATTDFCGVGVNPIAEFGAGGAQSTLALALGDYNGNGRLEVFEANTNSSYPSRILSTSTEEWVNPSPLNTWDAEWGDVDNDGDLDVVIGFDTGGNTLEVIFNESGQLPGVSDITISGAGPTRELVAGDWFGDGVWEIGGDSGPQERIWDLPGGAALTNTFGVPNTYKAVMADMDLDGDLDWVTATDSGVYIRWNSSGSFAAPLVLSLSSNPKSVAVDDINGDGPLDVVAVFDDNAQNNEVFLGDGSGSFTSAGTWNIGERSTLVVLAQLEAASPELEIIVNERPNSVAVYRYDPPTFTQLDTFTPGPMPGSFDVGDFDGDGNYDLVWLALGGWQFQVYRGIGDGTFDWASPLWESSVNTHEANNIEVGDINGDGYPDFAYSGDGEANGYFLNFLHTSANNFVQGWVDTDVTGSGAITLGDLERDGDLDFIATGGVNDYPYIWLNTLNQPSGLPSSFTASQKRMANTTPTVVWNELSKYRGKRGSSPFVNVNTTMTLTYTAYDEEFDRISRVDVFYSTVGGGNWLPATVSGSLTNVQTSPTGTVHNLVWDLETDNVPTTNDLVLQLRAYVGSPMGAGGTVGVATTAYPVQRSMVTAVTLPMRHNNPCVGVSCLAGETCYYGECFEDCSTTADCMTAPRTTCFLPDGRCDETDPCANITCPLAQVCYEGNCYTSCSDDGDCSPPSICLSSRCVDPTNDPYDPTCDGVQCPEGQNCLHGACFNSCSSSAMCTGTCFGDTCDANDNNDPCDTTVCPSGYICYAGSCYVSCSGNADCTPPSECINSTYCGNPSDPCEGVTCAAEQVCVSGSCFTFCSNDGDCSPPDICFNSACRDPDNLCDGIQCAEGYVCHEGNCYVGSCQDNSDCPGNTCFTSTTDCVTPDGYDTTWLGTTNNQWVNASNWSAGVPTPTSNVFICEAGPTPVLSSDVTVNDLLLQDGADINRNGFGLVVSGAYEANWCQTTGNACDGVACPNGHSCYEGACFRDCSDDADCDFPSICWSNRCAVDPCDDVSCPVGQVCYGGSCYPDCTDDGDCTPPNVCFDGRCDDDPCDGVQCPIGEICVGGTCHVGCTFNADCPNYRGQGSVFAEVAGGTNTLVSSDKEGGVNINDFNNDGCLDLMVGSANYLSHIQFQSDCNFPDPIFSALSQCDRPHLYWRTRPRSNVAGDLNHDGWLDFVRNDDDFVQMYLNDGTGRFLYNPSNPNCPYTGITNWMPGGGHSIYSGTRGGNGVNAEGVILIDFDGDKDLDVFFEDYSDGVIVMRNNICSSGTCGATSTFSLTEITPSTVGISMSNAVGDYCAVADVDVDGDVDFLCRKDGTSIPDLYINDGTGNFTGSATFNEDAGNNKGGVAFCDLDNDGDFDLVWTDQGTTQIWEQTAPDVWVATDEPEDSSGENLPNSVDDVACGDIDNDGDLDIYFTNSNDDHLFINRSTPGNWDFIQDNRGIDGDQNGEGVTMADYDRSGSLDIYVSQEDDTQFWENPLRDDRYLMIRALVDLGGGTTRDGIGATITIRDPDGAMLGVREVNGGRGHGSQDPLVVHYGLPYGADVPYDLTVRYPHGEVVRRCVRPSGITGYQQVDILDTDADDLSDCIAVGSAWTTLIQLPQSDGEFCYLDHCAESSCDGIQCGSEFVCYGGNCNGACTVSTDCGAGEICDNGVCVDSTDPECDGMNFVCPTNWECVAGECEPLCDKDSDCSPGEYCFENLCISDSCGSVTCGPGEICYRGRCFEGPCVVDSDCPAGESCYEGRCAENGCEALTDLYDADFYGRDTGKIVLVKQKSTPSVFARPFEGVSDAETWVGLAGGVSTNPDVPAAGRARVALYLDPSRADANNPLGRYVLWLQHGAGAGQGAAEATYRVRLKDPSTDPPDVILDDDSEGFRVLNEYQWIIQTQSTSGANDTGGVLIGPFDSQRDNDWTVRINAAFSGDIDRWEFVHSDGQIQTLYATEELVLKLGDFSMPDELITPDSYMPCINSSEKGICARGYGYCTPTREFVCVPNVAKFRYEVCDGEDNDCDGAVDDNVVVPMPQFRQDGADVWLTWLSVDTNDGVGSIMNYTPQGADDRSGGTDITTIDGPVQDINHQTLIAHRDLRTGEVSLILANSRPTTGAAADAYGDYDAEMIVSMPDSVDAGGSVTNLNSLDEAFIAWYDDREPGLEVDGSSSDDEIPKSETPDEFELKWKIHKTGSGATAYRDSDTIALRSAWSGATNELALNEGRIRWTKDDDDDYDDNDEMRWALYEPTFGNTSLAKSRRLHWRTRRTGLGGSVCLAAAPTVGGCPLSTYQCVAGALQCGTANDAVCNQCGDLDGDGWARHDPVLCPAGRDCDDTDPNTNPDAQEVCDGLDNDCDRVADVKDDDKYFEFWGEPRPASAASCPNGTRCGPEECAFNLTCVCPPGEDCRCGESLEENLWTPVPESGETEPATGPESTEMDDPQAACSTTRASHGKSPIFGVFGLLLLGAVIRRRRKR